MLRRNPLFALSTIVLIVAPGAAILTNRAIDAAYGRALRRDMPVSAAERRPPACDPAVPDSLFDAVAAIVPDATQNTAASEEMRRIFDEDQAARRPIPVISEIDPETVESGDRQRRTEVLAYLEQGKLRRPQDFVRAAFVFQHGNCPDHYRLANALAKKAMEAGCENAKWIYAATLDRYLLNTGRLQKFGTQFGRIETGYGLLPTDPNTTDDERRRYNVPPIEEARAKAGKPGGVVQMRSFLFSWWFTLAAGGVSFAAAILAAAAPAKKRSTLVKVLLAAVLLLYAAGAAGHWLEARAFESNSGQPPIFDAKQPPK